jgi:hypothetical protein
VDTIGSNAHSSECIVGHLLDSTLCDREVIRDHITFYSVKDLLVHDSLLRPRTVAIQNWTNLHRGKLQKRHILEQYQMAGELGFEPRQTESESSIVY